MTMPPIPSESGLLVPRPQRHISRKQHALFGLTVTMIRCEVGLRLSLPDSGRRLRGKRMIKSRAMLLAGVSALAMLACVAEADAEKFSFTGGVQSFTAPTAGEY